MWKDAQSEKDGSENKSSPQWKPAVIQNSVPLVCALDVLTSRQQVGAQVLLVRRN